ncbi:DUF3962 domain-containing protein [Streptomyces sp. ISL-66]|uniref:pPIWI_RE module domain-containing protein n=1 Tax=Streptomyces sp. ISL-66 TaxID=2819186 RepID=UPI001BECEAD2|nr:DUF3962 domain-containing protein [Streptomyces sp. ISL-66]MBT2469844.1 DUF3962 domain-containing protein [Streptomyces sp. ISL-66]
MSTPESRLALLTCPLDQNSVGTAWLYRLPEKVDGAWFALRDRYYGTTGSKVNLPYAGLLTVLRASGHTSASLHPPSKENPPRYLALSRELDANHLRNVIALWEQALLLTPREDITLNYPSELADLISSVQPEQVALWDHIRRGDTCVDAKGWVFDAANWNLTQKLAGTPLEVDGCKISLRADTENNLLAWEAEHLWQSTWQAARPTRTRTLFPTTSRLSHTLRGARSAWLAPKASTGQRVLPLGFKRVGGSSGAGIGAPS